MIAIYFLPVLSDFFTIISIYIIYYYILCQKKTPIIKPYKTKDYSIKQSKYDGVDNLPTRSILLAASNSGKTVLLTNFILNIYKDCWDAVYIFSPSINLDDNWIPVREYLDKRNKVGDKIYYDEYAREID
jgi:hypothetical protein